MNEYQLPPVRLDSPPMDAASLSQQTDWGLREHRMPDLWKRSAGEGILVIVLDTGVPRHVDLPEPLFTANFTSDSSAIDRNGHQTHCSGIVAAKNDENGVVGWAPEATLAHIKVLSDRGSGRSDWIEAGVRHGIKLWNQRKSDFVGCVMSMSLGGRFDPRQGTSDHCRRRSRNPCCRCCWKQWLSRWALYRRSPGSIAAHAWDRGLSQRRKDRPVFQRRTRSRYRNARRRDSLNGSWRSLPGDVRHFDGNACGRWTARLHPGKSSF